MNAKNSLLRGSLVLFAAMLLVNVLNYGYALLLGRYLGPVEYGAYAAFMSLFLLVTLLPMTLQQTGARYRAMGMSVAGYTSRLGFWAGGAIGLLMLVFCVPLGQMAHLPWGWFAFFGILMPIYGLLGVARGEAQGRQEYGRLGFNMVFEHLSKILLTFPVLAFVSGSSGAVIATLAGLPLALALLAKELRQEKLSSEQQREVRGYALPVLINLAAQALILNADLLLAKALLPAEDAGLYASVAMIGRIVFYSSWAVGAAVFPMVSKEHAAGRPHQKLLWLALGAVAVVSALFVGVCLVAPQLVVGILFGKAYLSAASWVAAYAAMTMLYALANVVANHYLALGQGQLGNWALAAGVVQLGLMLAFHGTAMDLISVQAVAKGGLLLIYLAVVAQGLRAGGNAYVVR